MKHILAIDETGSMTMSADDKSFVCGVLISSNELTIKQKYKQAYEKMKLGTPAPNQMENLIGNKQFHFSEMENFQKNICRELLLPLADKIYVSKGKPTLYANNQNWWLVAVSVVISEFLKDETFESNDEVEILIDNRSDNTFGLIEDDNGNTIDFYAYHKILKEQIERSINTIAKAYNIKLNIKFKADTASFYINLADVVCGFVRIDRNHIKQSIIECPCSKFMSGNNPALFVDNNPMVALTLIFQEVSNAKLNNIGFTAQVIEKLRNNAEYYSLAWDMFYDLVKTKIAERTTNSVLIGIKPFVDIFITEFNHNKTYLSGSKCLELMVLFVEYFSHIGQTESPCKKEDFIKYLQNENEKSETRLLRKWEKLVSFSLRNVQILFNAYNFSEAIADLETLWEEQEKIIKSTSAFIGTEKDEPTTAI
ncbi:MAG: hypothetical protein PHR53_07400, partial [Bacteroidales bacterium]|nr:hypothetical protein [Bacteroidales bacterium]